VTAPPALDRPLAGVRVLDFTLNLPGPYASATLQGLGAEVIKIEPPRGDTARGIGRLFHIVNAGKKSVTLDLKSDEGRAALARLLPSADVLMEGFRPGVMEGFGFGPTEALAANPRLVYCSISGYGQTGPYRDYPGHDLNLQAVTGVCHMMRAADGEPHGCALPIADLSSASSAVSAICAALYRREKDGRGCTIDLALTDTVLTWAYVWSQGLNPDDANLDLALRPARKWLRKRGESSGALAGVLDAVARTLDSPQAHRGVAAVDQRLKRSRPFAELERLRLHVMPHYGLYRTRDGRWISVGIVDEEKFWRALCEGLALPQLSGVPSVARILGRGAVRRLLARAFARRDLQHWLTHFDRRQVPLSPVLPVAEALHDAHLRTRGAADPGGPVVAFPMASHSDAPAPRLGQHNAEILGPPAAR
jgi:crotonobetainyl-CoA:carnitine CoA-transferase CaiB-like acyl-CoA transferase